MPSLGDKAPIIPVLTGPTGAGKTSLAFKFMDRHPGLEMISADSRQIYRNLNIGTDKPTPEEISRYSIHLVDCVEPGDRFTAFDFVEQANRLIGEILDRGRLPLVCGGTGLYIKSLAEGIVEIPDGDFGIRDDLEKVAETDGPETLHEKLKNIDPIEAYKVHPNNVKKVIRALEIYYLTGKSKSEIMAVGSYKNIYEFKIICYLPPREHLYEKINSRVDLMLECGLRDEIEMLINMGLKDQVRQINVIGYNELFEFMDGHLSFDEAMNLVKQNSRRFAKRQITWLKSMQNIQFCDKPEGVLDCLSNIVEGRNI